MKKLYPIVVLLWLMAFVPVFQAQNAEIMLTLQLMPGMEYLQDASVLRDFEALHPKIRLNVSYDFSIEDSIYPSPTYDREAFFHGIDTYTASADVLMASIGEGYPPLVDIEGTRAGYVLDLAPLINADPDFDTSTFYPSAWRGVQWDGGLWMVPTVVQIYTISYNIAAFDEAGLSYPDETWEIDDYVNAIQVLTEHDATGTALGPGFIGFNNGNTGLLYSFLNAPLYDIGQFPAVPQFNRPDVRHLAQQWVVLQETGAEYNPAYPYAEDWSPEYIPLSTDRITQTIYSPQRGAVSMPGGRAFVQSHGFIISSRTQYPQAAYELLKFLTDDSRVAAAYDFTVSSSHPARSSYPEVETSASVPHSLGTLSGEMQALLEDALMRGITPADTLFFDYFHLGLSQVVSGELDITTALRDWEIIAKDALADAATRRESVVGIIPTPVPVVDLPPDEIEIRFHYSSIGSSVAESVWDDFITTFVEADEQVGRVVIEDRLLRLERVTDEFDCFYFHYNLIPTFDLRRVYDMTPLLAADSETDMGDALPGVWQQFQRDGSTWAYPLDMQPTVIWLDPDVFAQAGLMLPDSTWTASDFTDIVTQLSRTNEPAFYGWDSGNTLLMLIAVYGGLPLDFRGDPVTLHFTDETTVAAIRQALDMAKAGTITYSPLSENNLGSETPQTPITAYTMDAIRFFDFDGDVPIVFPSGTSYTPVSYDIGAAYISRQSQYPEACYRFIRALSHRPDLLSGLPVSGTQVINSPDISLSDVAADLYSQIEAQLNQPNVVFFPGFAIQTPYATRYWLYRAFDRYVFEDANLSNELTAAEQFTRDFLTCVDKGETVVTCAVQIDPTSASYFDVGQSD